VWRLLERSVAELWRSGPLLLVIGISPALALWPLVHRPLFAARNDLSRAERQSIVIWAAVSLLVSALALAAYLLRQRRAEPGRTLADALARIQPFTFAGLALPLVTALAAPNLEKDLPIVTAGLIVALAALAATFTYRLLGLSRFAPAEEPFQPAQRPQRARLVVGAAMLGYALLISYYAVLDHHNLSTRTLDLGLYENLVWNTLHGDFLGTTLARGGDHTSAHFDPILAVVALPYALFQHAEGLLVIQTLWLCSGALAVWALARHHLHNEWFAAACAVMFLLYPPLHGANLFEFHSLALIVPIVMWAVFCLDGRRVRAYWPVLVLLLLCREDVSLLCCFLGVYAILSGLPRTGVATVGLSLAYLFVVKKYAMHDSSLLMKDSSSTYSYAFYFKDMLPVRGEGAGGIVVTLLSEPLRTLKVLLKPDRMQSALRMFVPLLGLPLLASKKRVLMLYGFAFLGLSSLPIVYSIHFQYTSVLFPVLFAALPDAMRRVVDSGRVARLGLSRARLAWALLAALVVASAGISLKHGAFVPNATFRAGWNLLDRFPDRKLRERYAKLRQILQRLPPGAAISASDSLLPHVASRRDIFRYPELGSARYLLVAPAAFGGFGARPYRALLKDGKLRKLDSGHGIELYEIRKPAAAARRI
jgi:uncharacterized membrane protein